MTTPTKIYPLPPLPTPNNNHYDMKQWRDAKGWWLATGKETCFRCHKPIPIGDLVYLTGDPGYIVCQTDTPKKPPTQT
jgi:hypothetical protein